MTQDVQDGRLGVQALQQFNALQPEAVSAVSERFYATHGSLYEKFGPGGRDACREDLNFHVEFLRPALEFGLLQPMVDYLCWLDSVLTAREIPAQHLALSLEWLGEFYAARMAGADGVVVKNMLMRARDGFLAARALPLAVPEAPGAWPECAAFQAALLGGRQHEAQLIVNQCLDKGKTLVEVEMHLIQPALYAIGKQWQFNEVSVAQEHMATGIAHAIMSAGLLRAPPAAMHGKRVLLACVEGNNHAVGLRMVSDAFELAGWEVQYLGANVPTRALVHHAFVWNPDLVGLSVSFAHQLRAVKNVIVQLGDCFGVGRPPVIIGGLLINQFAQLTAMVGADGHCVNAQDVLLKAEQLVAGKSRR